MISIGYNPPSSYAYASGNNNASSNGNSQGVLFAQANPDPNQIPTNNPNPNPADQNPADPNSNPSNQNPIPINRIPSDPTNPTYPNSNPSNTNPIPINRNPAYSIPPSVKLNLGVSFTRKTTIDHTQNSRKTESDFTATATLGDFSAKYKDTTEESGEIEKTMPPNTAIGREDGNTCKLTVKRNDGIVQKFEAPKPKGSSCIVNKGGEVIPLTDKNSIYDSEDGTLIVTQTTTSIPAGVSIEYEQISKKK